MRRWLGVLILTLATLGSVAATPVIYCTDLFHPPEDPDDHFDLATLFALPELEVKAILLDQGERQRRQPGAIPLRQMRRLTGQRVPFAAGLEQKLVSSSDTGLNQADACQAGVRLLLQALRDAVSPVTIFTTGSVRDVCAAWNREPALLREKVARVYLNLGNASPGQSEYNVDLDPQACVGLLRSGLPIYLGCCLPMSSAPSAATFSTWWHFRQAEVLAVAPPGLQNFFIYALQRCPTNALDPLQALSDDLRPWQPLVWEMNRNMWCTATFLHAAGRKLTPTGQGWRAVPGSPSTRDASPFAFVPAQVTVNDTGQLTLAPGAREPNLHLFKITAPDVYPTAMRDCVRELFRTFPERQ
ncbi:MAG TPA: nucleoside hydrolase [Verrucomicrobiota bacterium]|nr:nucleoside hydrolase [Verrucomicrobiota bacterium]HNT13359.1 nucleoside hydrolase [Verrucomicrobiota bacterium]